MSYIYYFLCRKLQLIIIICIPLGDISFMMRFEVLRIGIRGV